MLIPQSMSYAALAGMPPEYGFYAVVGALVVYALFGSSRHLGVGPEPGTAILAATGVATVAGGDPRRYITLMAGLAIVVGAVCVLAAAVRLGYLASMLSKPVLVGYITGVGLILLSSQFAAFTGASVTADSFFSRCWQLATSLDEVQGATIGVGAATLVLMLSLRWAVPNAPVALVGVVLATAVTAVFSLDHHGVALVGFIPSGLPTPALPDIGLHDIARLLPVAAGIALVGFTDNVLTARAIASRKGYRIDPNQELLALGMINLTAGISRGFPISSSASRTAVPASLGSRTQLVSVIGSGFVVITLLAVRPVLSQIPRAALAAVIVIAAIAIIDLRSFARLWRISPEEGVLAAAATIGVLVLGVLYGIVIAVAMSIAVALARIGRPHDAVLGDLPEHDGWVDVGEYPNAVTTAGLVVFRFDAPLIFINAERFSDRIDEVLSAACDPIDWLVIDCEGIGTLDASAVDVLQEVIASLERRHISTVAVARTNDHVLDRMRRARLTEPGGPIRVFPTINAAVRAFGIRPK